MRFDAMIGTGGIGSGSFFLLNGNTTLGREESRGGRYLDRRDYCKLHIISHYVKALMGSKFAVVPVGKVGEDDPGNRLISEMREAGLDMRYVEQTPDAPTLFSFCFVYPDGSGGNMTTDDSACSRVDEACVMSAQSEFERYAGRGVALAAPEVPLDARKAILDLGTKHTLFRVASFTSEEIVSGLPADMLGSVDLLALNIDEAAAIAGCGAHGDPSNVVQSACERLYDWKKDMLVSVTAGSAGSWCWDGSDIRHLPVHEVEVASTAGAGDAHLSGIIAGLSTGMSLADAHELGSLTAAMSVTSPHTINPDISRASLRRFAGSIGASLPSTVGSFLEG